MLKRLPLMKGKPFDFSQPGAFATSSRLTEAATCYINGQWMGSDGRTIAVEDPCTNETIGEIPNFGKAETEAAIGAAEAAFREWRSVMPRERATIVRRWARSIETHKQALGTILSRESGKMLAEGVGEVVYAERFVEWYAGEAERIYGDVISGPRPGVQTTVWKEPTGVVGVITPWNFPAAMITRSAAAAIAAGCTVVIKPSSETPFTALALAQLAEEAGVPPGVLNVVTGDAPEISAALLESFAVRKLAFTGSTRVGKELYRRSADTMKKLGLELGGNAPFIVFEDADLERAVEGAVMCKFRNAGQTCISCNRVFVQSSVYETFKRMLVARVRAMKVGNSFDPAASIGAMISRASVQRMREVVQDAVDHGAVVETGGRALEGRGYFFEPTILSGACQETMRCCREELFGPVLPLISFDTEEAALSMANDTRAGLASYFYTTDYRRQHRVAAGLRFGMVGVNDVALSAPCAPFGGVKESGLGRDGSRYGIEPYVDIKYVMLSKL